MEFNGTREATLFEPGSNVAAIKVVQGTYDDQPVVALAIPRATVIMNESSTRELIKTLTKFLPETE